MLLTADSFSSETFDSSQDLNYINLKYTTSAMKNNIIDILLIVEKYTNYAAIFLEIRVNG